MFLDDVTVSVDLPEDEATKLVLTGIEESIFCRIVKRLVSEKMTTEEGYKELVSNKTCFEVRRRRRRTACIGRPLSSSSCHDCAKFVSAKI